MATTDLIANPADQLRALLEETFDIVLSASQLDPGEQLTATLSRPLGGLALPGIPSPVDVTVRWSARADDAPRTPLVDGRDVESRDTTAIPATFRFAPRIVEDTRSGPAASTIARIVRVEITATVAPVPILLPGGLAVTVPLELPVAVLPLAVPTILVLCRHTSFAPSDPSTRPPDGFALAIVPGDSPLEQLTVTALNALLGPLNTILSSLAGLGGFAALLTGLGRLRTALVANAPHVKVVGGDQPILNRITMIQRNPVQNDIEAAAEASSLVLLGHPGARARCFVRRNFNPTDGRLDVTTGPEAIAVVANLHADQPSSVPAGRAAPNRVAAGSRTFGDSIRSIQLL